MENLIALISDTHENSKAIRKAVALITAEKPDLVVHCGDIISPPILELFKGLPMRFVFGNNDGERSGLKKKCEELGFDLIDDTITFNFAERSFFVNHGTRESTIDAAILSQSYDYVLHGHTHEKRDEKRGKTRVINPGALFNAESYSIAFLNIESDSVKFVEVDL